MENIQQISNAKMNKDTLLEKSNISQARYQAVNHQPIVTKLLKLNMEPYGLNTYDFIEQAELMLSSIHKNDIFSGKSNLDPNFVSHLFVACRKPKSLHLVLKPVQASSSKPGSKDQISQEFRVKNIETTEKFYRFALPPADSNLLPFFVRRFDYSQFFLQLKYFSGYNFTKLVTPSPEEDVP